MTTLYSRIGAALVALGAAAVVAVTACSQGSEGDRCNPLLAAGESECHGSLSCITPDLCPEAYCCPTTADGGLAASSDPHCQTGCGGGAASICNVDAALDDGGACAFACKNDPGDLTSPTTACSGPSGDDGGGDASSEASSPATDGGTEAAKDASASDGGPG